MRVMKELEHSFLANIFNVDGKFYFAGTVMLAFDLLKPDTLIKETEMWPKVMKELGKDAVFEQAMPKPNGEFLAAGSCFSPKGTKRNASEVSVSVGGVSKTLNVFGDRFWINNGGFKTISNPADFQVMPVKWQRAFGGGDIKENPSGIGTKPVKTSSGDELIPLPNIENPNSLIGDPSDRPAPAGFMNYGVDWPQRAKYLGTYDEKWKRTRWPYFPEDMNYKYFCAAPADQYIDGYFKGDEAVEIINMHPEHQVITSSLPKRRVRFFMHQDTRDGRIFKETKTVLDTVWLFPSELTGVAVYRAVTEVQGEEYEDVFRVFIADEDMYGKPETIEHYEEVVRKKADKSVSLDNAEIDKAKAELKLSLKKIQDIPNKLNDAKMRALGKAPKAKLSPRQTAEQIFKELDRVKGMLAKSETKLAELKDKFGHYAKVPVGVFEKLSSRIDVHKQKVLNTVKKCEDIKKNAANAKKEQAELIKGLTDDELFKQYGDADSIDLSFIEADEAKDWSTQGHIFASECFHTLRMDSEKTAALKKAGITDRIIRKTLIGYNPEKLEVSGAQWGLEDETITLAAGYVFPFYDGAELIRLTIYEDLKDGLNSPNIIKGSVDTAPYCAFGEGKAVVVVQNDADMWLACSEVGDFAGVLSMHSPSDNIADEAGEIIDGGIPVRIYSASQDKYNSDGRADVFENAEPVISDKGGENLFQCAANGEDIQDLLLRHIPDAPKAEDLNDPLKSKVPKVDFQSFFSEIKEHLISKAKVDPKNAKAYAKSSLAEFENIAEGAGPTKGAPQSDTAQDIAGLKSLVEEIHKGGHIDEASKAEMTATLNKLDGLDRQSREKLKTAKEKVAALKERKKDPYPDKIKKIMEKHGINTDTAKKLNADEAVQLLKNGESLKYRSLKGVDFSNLDLTGADFSGAVLTEADFTGAVLKNAVFEKAVCDKAVFTNADCREAKFKGSTLTEAVMQKTKAAGADFRMCALTKADCTGADFTGASFEMASLTSAVFKEANLARAKISKAACTETDMTSVYAKGAQISKSVFSKADLTGADFSESTIKSVVFSETKAGKISFENAKISQMQIIKESVFEESVFSTAQMHGVCFMNSNLNGADFGDSTLEKSMIESCSVKNSNFRNVDGKMSRLNKSDLESADMRNINLLKGSMRKTRLSGADLSDSNLYGVELYKVKLKQTVLSGANLKMTPLAGREDLIDE